MNLSWMDFYDEALINEIIDFLGHPGVSVGTDPF